MPRGASADEIRLAYRRAARQAHPDTNGPGAAVDMAMVNEAYRVLSDPGRRAMYDATLRGAPAPPSGGGTWTAHPTGGIDPDDFEDPSFEPASRAARLAFSLPWAIVLAVLALIFVFTAFAVRGVKTSGGDADGVLKIGSCVAVQGADVAVERPCSGPHDGVVRQLVLPDASCPATMVPLVDPRSPQRVCVTSR